MIPACQLEQRGVFLQYSEQLGTCPIALIILEVRTLLDICWLWEGVASPICQRLAPGELVVESSGVIAQIFALLPQ